MTHYGTPQAAVLVAPQLRPRSVQLNLVYSNSTSGGSSRPSIRCECHHDVGAFGSEQEVLVLQAKHRGAPVAAVIIVLVGNVLTRGHKVCENTAERQFVGQTRSAGGLEDARR